MEVTMRKVALSAVVAAATVAVGASSAAAASTGFVCTGTLASGSYKKITVPAGATCDGTNATITVRGGIRVRPRATFILGSEGGTGGGTISGGLRARRAASVQLHFARVRGGVRITGGNGFFSTVEDNVINGGATIKGYTGVWLGFIRNTIHGTTRLNNNTLNDPDANEFVTNTIRGNLVCHNNAPAPHVGDSGGSPNNVSGRKVGQCAARGL
jgi:hypothetical protein